MINVRRDGCPVKTARCMGASGLGLLFAGVLAQGFASAGEATAAGVGLTPKQLRCEYLVNPPGIDEQHPRLSWVVESGERGQRQTAYQVVVASEDGLLGKDRGDLWDSGKVASEQTTSVVYGGKALASQQRCFWKLKVWDKDGRALGWSEPATWGMGLLQARDWKAQYISFRDTTPVHRFAQPLFLPPARQYRKEFAAVKAVRRAMIYSTALGIYELHLNGQRVADALFAPGWSDYHQRAYYNTYDVTALVKPGANALGAWVADGWYSGYIGFGLLTTIGTEAIGRYTYGKTPALMAQLEIEYADGSQQRVVTDISWKVTGAGPIQEADFLMGERYDARKEMRKVTGAGPIQEADFLMGERYDARKEMPGWSKPGFDDSKWEAAIRAEDNGKVNAKFYEYQNPAPGGQPKIEGRETDLGFKRPPKLEAFPGVPVRAIEEIKPRSEERRVGK